MMITIKDGKGNIKSVSVDENAINAKMEQVKSEHLCTDCYASRCKIEGINLGKSRVLKGIETPNQVLILECRDYHILKDGVQPPIEQKSNISKEERDIRNYSMPRARIIHPAVAKAFNHMK